MKSLKHYITEAAGISHLHDADSGVFGKLMNQDVLVTIKVDSAALVVLNDNGVLRFFNRGAQKEIDLIHRAGMDVFEGVIGHIEKTDWKKLPSGVMFFLEYFNDNLKPLIKYSERPQNNMILLFAKKGTQIIRADDPIMMKAAGILGVSAPPIIHKGPLTDKQKRILQDFVETPADHRKERFGLDKFRDMVLNMFGVEPNNQWLVKDGLEGLVFLFGKDKNPTQFKLVDPDFTSRIIAKGPDKMKNLEDYRRLVNELMWANITDVMVDIAIHKARRGGFTEFAAHLALDVAKKIPSAKLKPFEESVKASRMFGFSKGITPDSVIAQSKVNFFFEDVFRQLLFTLREEKGRANPKTGITGEVKDRVNSIVEKLRGKHIL